MKKMKDSCFNEFDPNAMSVEAALKNIIKSINSIKTGEYVDRDYYRLLRNTGPLPEELDHI